MSDVFTKAKRSEVMARIRSRGNKDTEVVLAALLRAHGIVGWRRHLEIRTAESGKQKFKVKPDFVFPKSRTALFVDGCFWHGCPKHGTQPKGNHAFWKKKFAQNKARDQLVNRALRRAGWKVLRVWEHELAKIKTSATPHPGPLPDRGGEGADTRLLNRIRRTLK